MKKKLYSIVILAILLFMFLKPLQAVEASKTGLLLWFNTIIPTLLPFMILSNILIRLDAVSYLTCFVSPVLSRLLGLSKNGCYAVITGFLCGYPMGAKVTADLVAEERISKTEGQYLLSFCNNVSPMFIISYIVFQNLNAPALLVPTLVILFGSPVICALLFRIFLYRNMKWTHFHESKHKKKTSGFQINFKIIDVSIMNGFETVTKLGGYIILFAIIAGMIAVIPVISEPLKYTLIGVIEITNGISKITSTTLPFALQYTIILCITSFGGLSSIAQTQSMIKSSGLSLNKYIAAKIANTCITGLMIIIIMR